MALCVILAQSVSAQVDETPLSAIEWLSEQPPSFVRPAAQPNPTEPPISETASPPAITVAPLTGSAQRRFGLLPPDVSGFAPDLWRGAALGRLRAALADAQKQRLPAGQQLLVSLLLAEAAPLPHPRTEMDWLLLRLDTLMELGAVDPGLTLVEQSKASLTPAIFDRWLSFALLAGRDAVPCARLAAETALSTRDATRIYCTARNGDFDTAALLFGTSAALSTLSEDDEQLLARYLDPDLFEDAAMPRAPLRPDPLTFTLHAAAGRPIPTFALPIAFAHTDLSPDRGWKAQLEAAERLARAGVLPVNQLLGLYAYRDPAASGGIWDRVDLVQQLDRGLKDGDPDRVGAALPALWRAAQAAGLETALAEMFAEALRPMDVADDAQAARFRLALLSSRFEQAALPNKPTPTDRYLHSVAQGKPILKQATSPIQNAVATAFAAPLVAQNAAASQGAALLKTLGLLAQAGRNDVAALQQALIDLRSMGFDRVARQTALQALIVLERS